MIKQICMNVVHPNGSDAKTSTLKGAVPTLNSKEEGIKEFFMHTIGEIGLPTDIFIHLNLGRKLKRKKYISYSVMGALLK